MTNAALPSPLPIKPAQTARDCPALHERHHDKGYPFGERVPAKIRMKRTVSSDFAWMDQNAVPPAIVSTTFDAWTNSYGAVAAIYPDGRKLGVKPDEFEVIEWFYPPSVPPSPDFQTMLELWHSGAAGRDVALEMADRNRVNARSTQK